MKEILLIITLTLGIQASLIEELKEKCNKQNAKSCNSVAVLYMSQAKQNYVKAKAYYGKACELNYAEGCSGLGNLYYLGQGVEQDYSKAKIYFTQACELASSVGCNHLGDLYYTDQWLEYNTSSAEFYYGKSCTFGNKKGCYNLKILQDEDEKIKKLRDKYELRKKEQDQLVKEAELLDDIL